MKWGRRKLHPPPSPPSSSSRPSLISHVFPTSWLSKFKQKSATTSEPKPRKVKHKGKWNSSTSMSSPRYDIVSRENGCGKLYDLEDDDDAYWRLSFRESGTEVKKSGGVLRSVWYDSDDVDEFEVPSSSCRNCRVNAAKVREREQKQKVNSMHRCKKEKETGLRTPRSRSEKELKLGKAKRGATEKKPGKAEKISTKYVEDDELGMEEFRRFCREEKEKLLPLNSDTRRLQQYASPMDSRNPLIRKMKIVAEEGPELGQNQGISVEKMSSDWKTLKQQKIEEIKSKSEEHRKSLHISRELQRRRTNVNSKVRVCSPRTTSRVELCKIKALEDMKKAKLKMKKEAKERTVQLRKGFDSFAVVKCSYDPQQDFRESMVEMIMEKGIDQPEEFEELLACYLTLNSDEYHDLIIKVFRQVWFDLNQSCFDTELTE